VNGLNGVVKFVCLQKSVRGIVELHQLVVVQRKLSSFKRGRVYLNRPMRDPAPKIVFPAFRDQPLNLLQRVGNNKRRTVVRQSRRPGLDQTYGNFRLNLTTAKSASWLRTTRTRTTARLRCRNAVKVAR
jgi:hypothetical protein